MQAFTDHVRKGQEFASDFEELFTGARKLHKGKLDLAGYTLAHDPCYLGVNGRIVIGKPWGQDSSNIQAILNAESYWKRLYYREPNALQNEMDKFAKNRGDDKFEDGYGNIKENIKELVMTQGKPKTSRSHPAERLNFFNTPTKDKYQMKGVISSKSSYNFEKRTHRSRPHEARYIASLYFRTDTDII